MEIAPEEISINSARLYVSENGYEFNTKQYKEDGDFRNDSTWTPAESTTIGEAFSTFGWLNHRCNGDETEFHGQAIMKLEDGSFKCENENCNMTWSNRNELYKYAFTRVVPGDSTTQLHCHFTLAYNNFFRTSDGKVAYCADNGKKEPVKNSMEMTEKVDKKIRRILMMGYPNKTTNDSVYSDCSSLTDSDLELATQLAIYIAEGTFFYKDGSSRPYVYDEEYINKYYILLPYDINGVGDIATSENMQKAENKEKDIKKVIHKLLEYANDESIDIQEFEFNVGSLDIQPTDGGRLFGPYNINTNITSNINLSTNANGIEFRDAENNTINNVQGNSEFYVFVPTGVEAEIDITAEAPGVSVLPSYYYGNDDMTVQKMLVASPVNAKITAHIDTVKELMPGDVIDISWVVENTANKAVVTRNKVYIYWDNENDELADKYGNAIDSTYIMKQNTNSKAIQKAMFDKADLSEYLFTPAGEVKEFELDGVTHTGYEFTMMGDWLDGVGNAAETIRPNGTNLHYGESEGEIDYDSLYDDNSYTTDTVSFKIGFSPYANIHTSGKISG